jgi:DNA-binding response OmpR family regulator
MAGSCVPTTMDSEPSVDRSLEGTRVLVLEDEFFMADDLARALRKAGAEPIGPVGTVAEAESLVKSEQPDAAILDLNLRGEMADGFARRISGSKLPCVIVSGYGAAAMPSVSDIRWLEKPVSPAKVIETLAMELGRAR